MTTEAVKQDENKQIAETEKQPVCKGWLLQPAASRGPFERESNSSSTTSHASRPLCEPDLTLQWPMQFTTQAIYFLFFFLFSFGDLPTHCRELNWLTEGSGECEGWGRRGSVWPTGEQKLFCGNQAGLAIPPRQSLPASVATGWSAESRMTCYFGTLPK